MKILVLAGGADQAAFIKELQSRGHEVVLLDYLDNPPAKKIVDKHIQESTLDIKAVERAAKKENVDLICTACTDQALLTVAKVSEDLKLPCYISYKSALDVTNKSFMKQRMEDFGIPTAKHRIITNLDELNKVRDLSFPLVVKPSDCNSSKGVVKVSNDTELEAAIKQAMTLSRSSIVIVEEFKDGEEISVDIYFEGKVPKLLCATTSFKIKGNNGFTILGSDYPALTSEEESTIISIAKKIGEAFELADTPLILQTILKDGFFNVIEFSARMGGGSKYKLIETISGVNILSKYTDLILGEKPTVAPKKLVPFARMKYAYCNNGTIDNIYGLDELLHNGIIGDYFIYKSKGDTIEKHNTSSDRPFGYLIKADSKESIDLLDQTADQTLKVIDFIGKDIMIHGLNLQA